MKILTTQFILVSGSTLLLMFTVFFHAMETLPIPDHKIIQAEYDSNNTTNISANIRKKAITLISDNSKESKRLETLKAEYYTNK